MSQRSIAYLADPHAHAWKSHAKLISGVNSRLADTCAALWQAAQVAQRESCKVMAIAGDIFHVRGTVRPSVINAIVNVLQRICTSLGLAVVIIPGNHDMEHFKGGDTAVDVLGLIPGVTVVKSPTYVKPFGDDWKMACIPYIHDQEEFKRVFANMDQAKAYLIHQGIDNFKTEPGMPDTGVTAKWLLEHKSDEAWVMAGHYHQAQQNGRIISIGPPLQHNFGDENVSPGFWVVTDTNAQWHCLRGIAPCFVTIKADGLKDLKAHKDDVDGNFVRVKTTKPNVVEKLRERLEEYGAQSIVFEVEKEYSKAHKHEITISTPRKMLHEFLSLVEPYKDNKDSLLKLYDKITGE